MGISPVRKGQPLTAAAWNQLATEINNITSATGEKQWGRVIPCTILNRSISPVKAGETLVVHKGGTVRIATYTPDEARQMWMNSGFQLDGYGGSSSDYGTPALLQDGVQSGEIGRCMVSGLVAGYVTYSENAVPDLVKYTSRTGTFVSAGSSEVGDWKIIAHSRADANKRIFAYLVPATIQDLQRQVDKLGWGDGSGGGGDSGSFDDNFRDKVQDYFDCSDAIKDPVLTYDTDGDGAGENVHPTDAVFDVVFDNESALGKPEYVLLANTDENGDPVHDIGFYAYGYSTSGSADSFLKVDPNTSQAPSGVNIDIKSTSADNPLGMDVLTAIQSDNVTYLTAVQKTTSRPTITCSGTFLTSPGTATTVLSDVTETTGAVTISGTGGTTAVTGVSFSANGSATLGVVETGGIEVVVGISCEGGQLRVQTARLAVNYLPPVLSTTTTTLSINGGSSVLTGLTKQTASVVESGTATTGSPTAALDADVLTDISTTDSTNTLVSGVTSTRIGATLKGITTFTPSTHGIESDPYNFGVLVRGEPIIATKRSNAVTTALLDCGEESTNTPSGSGSTSGGSTSGSGENTEPEPTEPTPDPEEETTAEG